MSSLTFWTCRECTNLHGAMPAKCAACGSTSLEQIRVTAADVEYD